MTDLSLMRIKLSTHHSKNEVIERYNFFTTHKGKGQSIDNYIIQLRNTAKTCNFGDMTESLIRDKILLELQDKSLQYKLLNIKNLDLSTLVSVFNEHKRTQRMKRTTNIDNTIKLSHSMDNIDNDNKQNVQNCKRCNYEHHRNACPARGFKCHKCNMYNHFTNCCLHKSDKKNVASDKNVQKTVLELPNAPPLDFDNTLYPDLNHMKSFQENILKKIKNRKLQKSGSSMI